MHLTSSTTIKIATIRLNIVHTTFLIKAADFFASKNKKEKGRDSDPQPLLSSSALPIELSPSIKQHAIFASLPFFAQEPEEVSIMFVVGLSAARASLRQQLFVAEAKSDPLLDVRCKNGVQLLHASVNDAHAVEII